MSKIKMILGLVGMIASIAGQVIDVKDIAKDIKGSDEKPDNSK